MGYVILLWHSLSLPYNYFGYVSGYYEQDLPKMLSSKLALIGHTGFKLENKNIDYNDNKDKYTPWLSVVLFGNPGTKRCVC